MTRHCATCDCFDDKPHRLNERLDQPATASRAAIEAAKQAAEEAVKAAKERRKAGYGRRQ